MRDILLVLSLCVILLFSCASCVHSLLDMSGYGEQRYLQGFYDATHLPRYTLDSGVVRALDSGRLKTWPVKK